MRLALLVYGVLNAVLYAGLTPLWEGFDEPFHYGYVQHLAAAHTLPVQRQTTLSEEIWQSFPLAPASYIVKRNLPMVRTFDEYFQLPPCARHALRLHLDRLDPALGAVPSVAPNYESLHAPLAYTLLAPLNAAWTRLPLQARVWRIRLVCALASTLATGLLVFSLARLLQLDQRSQYAVLFLTFSTQMFYAAVAHVANDWLAIPLFLLVLRCAVAFHLRPGRSTLFPLAFALAAGLWTKSYFLALIPFALGVVWVRSRWRDRVLFAAASLGTAAPWYIRNLVLYRNLDGQQENYGGVSIAGLVTAATRLPWLRSLHTTARSGLWEANNSAVAFSAATTSIMLLLLAAAALCYFRRGPTTAEWIVIAALLCHAAGLAYNNVVQFRNTGAPSVSPPPWIVLALWPPAYCLLLVRAPRLLRGALCCVWAYVICATYVAKLIPLYAGYSGHPAHLAELFRWYTTSFPQLTDTLATTALIPPDWIFALAAAVSLAALTLAVRLSLSHPQIAVIPHPARALRPQ